MLCAFSAFGQSDYYWVGGTGNWSNYSSHWATSSGGNIFHTTTPSSNDNVIFDSNSFSANNQTVTLNADNEPSMAFRTLFAQEMIRNGILMPWIAISQSHGDTELDLTLRAADKSLRVVKQALESDIDQFLLGPSIKPVFRAHN